MSNKLKSLLFCNEITKTYDGNLSIISLHHVINPNVIISAPLIVKTHISAHVMASINVNKNELENYKNNDRYIVYKIKLLLKL